MIFEYAVEPELVATWYDPKEGRYFVDRFGHEHGRLVSRYPNHWKKLTWDAFHSTDQNARKRMETLLGLLGQRMVHRGASYDGTRTWLENAESEHARCRFRAIIARANPRHVVDVLASVGMGADDEPLWDVPTGLPVPRDANELAAAIAPLLRLASEIVFVDPHFAPTRPRFVRTLEAFLRETFSDRPGPPPCRIEVQTGDELDAGYFAGGLSTSLS